MILADTSVWVDHLNKTDPTFADLLAAQLIAIHPFVQGEIALGNIRQRSSILQMLGELPSAKVANPAEVIHFITENRLFGTGLGYVDVHLLAAAKLTTGMSLWTRDKRLHAAAEYIGLAKHQLHS